MDPFVSVLRDGRTLLRLAAVGGELDCMIRFLRPYCVARSGRHKLQPPRGSSLRRVQVIC